MEVSERELQNIQRILSHAVEKAQHEAQEATDLLNRIRHCLIRDDAQRCWYIRDIDADLTRLDIHAFVTGKAKRKKDA